MTRFVDADEVLNAINQYARENGYINLHIGTIDSIISNVPTAERSQWIPCSEKLPEEKINPITHDFEEVLGTTIWGDVRHYKYGTPIGHDEAHFWYGFGIMDEEVIAWMPLPEPYKKEGEEK